MHPRRHIATASSQAVADASGDAAAGPRSLHRTLRLIEHLAHARAGLSLSALSGDLALPKSSLLGLLRPLCRYGYLAHTDGSYTLGPSAFRLGVAIMPTMSLSRTAAPAMRRLVDRSGETALIAVLDRASAAAVYVEKVESAQSIRYSVSLGTMRPLYCSAAGRVLLAFADDEFIEAFLRRAPFPALTPQTLTRGAELRDMLPRIREQRLAVTVGEVSSDVAGFAAPIFDHHDRVIAALAMAAPVSRTRADPGEYAGLVRQAANDISLALGHLPPPVAPDGASERREQTPRASRRSERAATRLPR
ncbi:MAG: IclR family transcriptional regulator [Rubrivivax sp.]|nr:IclR family transcriptional regulator [Burkholderiales bacterium]MCW5633493.1 IclR family transcriptional regulator [Rubrivivax sp.]